MLQILKDNEEFLDKVAIEVMNVIIANRPPTSTEDSAHVASIAYKQALAMLDAKDSIEQILNKTKFLYGHRKKNNVGDIEDSIE